MAFVNLICLLLLTLTWTFISSSSKPIKFELSPIPMLMSSQNPKEFITNIAISTLQRAHHLKHHSKATPSTPLFAQSSGGYIISLSLGTPPQKIPAFFDTGSSLVWVPCTSDYSCTNCTRNNNAKITTFFPDKSSSTHSVKCNNKKCHWLDQPNVMSSCPACARSLPGSCTEPCPYIIAYGEGGTYGKILSENLNLETKVISDFVVGCSLKSDQIPEGIVGFGRNPLSLPNQLKLNKFSYCLESHKFDDTLKSSSLILGDSGITRGLKYTPLLKNPPILPFNQYYYIHLEEISVGSKVVRIPDDIQVPDSKGNGGTVVDSGSTLTLLVPNVFNPIMEEFSDQMTHGQQKHVENEIVQNVMCMNVTGERRVVFPEVVFQFKGGVKMELTVDNYIRGGKNLLCLPFVNATIAVGQGGTGPAIILGNYQQQNFFIEYDIKNERFGLKKQICGS